jgi:hypothetical protein
MKGKPAFLRWIVLAGIALFVVGTGVVTAGSVLKSELYGQPLKGEVTSPAKLSALSDSKSTSGSAKTATMTGFSRFPKPDVEVYSKWYTTVDWDPWFIYSMESYAYRIPSCRL